MAGAGLAMMIVSIVSKIYTDTAGPGLTIYRPQCPPGFCILGDYAQEGDINKPNHGVMICVLMQSDSNLVVQTKGFTQVWSSEGPGSGHGYAGDNDDEGSSDGSNLEGSYDSASSASGNGEVLAFWEPKVPSREYAPLGHVATTNYQPPSESHVCVVHKSVASPGIPGKRLWVEEARMASIWTLAPSYHYLNIGLFLSSDSRTAPRLNQFWSLSLDVIPPPFNTSLTVKKLTRSSLELIYQGQECADTKRLRVYSPKAPVGYSTLGHYAKQDGRTKEKAHMLVVKEIGGKGLLRHPLTYQELWRLKSRYNNTEAVIWRPVPPPGFFCIGHVLGLGFGPPSTTAIVCLHWSVIGRGWPVLSQRVWWNMCSYNRHATIWKVTGLDECLSADTFVFHRGLHIPHWEELLFHCFYLREVKVK